MDSTEEDRDPKAAYLGPFRLLKRVATGGMAEVFAARVAGETAIPDLQDGQLVALKRLLPGFDEDADIVEMFHAEAKLSSKLSHAHIARCHGMSHTALTGEPFLVMEYVEGADLGEMLRVGIAAGSETGVSPKVLASVAIQTLDALAYVQGLVDESGQPLSVVHRDISPQNLRLQPHGSLKLLDFGIARFVGRDTDTLAGVLKGKHAYMSPEQVEGVTLDARSDLFSLGVLLYELATSARLFRAETVPDTLEQVRRCEITELVELRPDLEGSLAGLIMGCLSKDPAGRPDGASELLARSRELLPGGLEESRAVLEAWFVEVLGNERAERGVPDEIGPYFASLVSAEDKGEETTDQIGVPDATRVFLYGAEPPAHAPEPLDTQARWLLYGLAAFAVACVVWMAF